MLPSDVRGQGTRLVLAHGFTQNRHCWGPFLPGLATRFEVVAVDLPGHGESKRALGLEGGALALGATGGRAIYVGYSMGGRYALHLALLRPSLVRGLVLMGAHPGIVDPRERAERRVADESMAAALERASLDVFLDGWLAQPLFADLPVERQQRAERARNTCEGLASSLRAAGVGAQEDLWPRLPELTMPILYLAGESDRRYRDVGEELVAQVPNGELGILPASGHAAHLQRPEEATARVTEWVLREASRPDPTDSQR